MSRTNPMLNRASAAAFDFDVVTDVPPKPARPPEPVRTERSAATLETSKSEAAEQR
jgi:hypothetical protein